MPPLRRYIRISAHSLLEVRIFLENPADTTRWLLHPTTPALPSIFTAIQPLILPKLREERERTALTKGKGKKGKAVKDVVEGDGFRVVVFLTEGGTRHEVVVKKRTAKERTAREGGGGGGGKRDGGVVVIRDEDDEDGEDVVLRDVPVAGQGDDQDDADGEEVGFMETGSRRRRGQHQDQDEDEVFPTSAFQQEEDKKKLGFDTRYDGFSIWGKVLCLLVERKGGVGGGGGGSKKSTGSGGGVDEGAQKVMQEWISSTQVGVEDDDG